MERKTKAPKIDYRVTSEYEQNGSHVSYKIFCYLQSRAIAIAILEGSEESSN